jgi:hypothetical protein
MQQFESQIGFLKGFIPRKMDLPKSLSNSLQKRANKVVSKFLGKSLDICSSSASDQDIIE